MSNVVGPHFPGEPNIVPSPAEHTNEQREAIAASNAVLDVIEREASRPDAVIRHDLWFEEDGTFDLTDPSGPPLAEIRSPYDERGIFRLGHQGYLVKTVWDKTYLVGLRPDGLGQVKMLTRGTLQCLGYDQGGVIESALLNFRRDQITTASGKRTDPYGTSGMMVLPRELKDEPVEPRVLLQLSLLLPEAFGAKRQLVRRQQKSERVLGRLSLSIGDAMDWLRRSHATPEQRTTGRDQLERG